MKDNAPSGSDRNKAVSDALPMLDEVLDLAPALEANWSAEAATIPPGTLVNRAEPGAGPAIDEPGGGEGGEPEVEPGNEGEPEGGGSEESFIPDSFDLDSITDPSARSAVEALQKEWMGSYTQKRQADRQEVEEARRTAQETQALVDGLRDPEMLPHYLQLLGVDLTKPETLERFGFQLEGDELEGLDEPDLEAKVAQLEQQLATQGEEDEAAAQLEALDGFADQNLAAIEKQWDRKLSEDEDAVIRHRAESNPGPDGVPDYEAAAKFLKGILGQGVEQELKRRSEPGRALPGGKPGGKALDPNNDEERLQLGAAAAERALASQQT
jgi:hypothetical protein